MITVNAMGDNCPIPVIKTKKAMAALTGPETIEVLVDNEIAVQNVTKMASSSGGKVTSEKLGDAEYKVTIEMEGAPAADGAEAVCAPDARDNTVVVVSSNFKKLSFEQVISCICVSTNILSRLLCFYSY